MSGHYLSGHVLDAKAWTKELGRAYPFKEFIAQEEKQSIYTWKMV